METETKWVLGGVAVLAAGAYYWFVVRPKSVAKAAPLLMPPMPAAPQQLAPPPTNVTATLHQPPNFDLSTYRQVAAQVVKQGTFVPGGGSPPMPTGIRGADGFFYTWTPVPLGQMVQNPDTGTWISNTSKTQPITINTPLRAHPGAANSAPSTKVVLQPGMIYGLNSGEVRQ